MKNEGRDANLHFIFLFSIEMSKLQKFTIYIAHIIQYKLIKGTTLQNPILAKTNTNSGDLQFLLTNPYFWIFASLKSAHNLCN